MRGATCTTVALILACACTAPPEHPIGERDVAPAPCIAEPPEPAAPEPCNQHGPILPRPVVRLAADRELRLLAVELTGAEIQVFETQCWARVASFSGIHPQFVGRELAFAGMTAIHRWEPESDTLSTIYEGLSPTRSTHAFVIRSFDDLLLEDPQGTVVRVQDGRRGRRVKGSPRELCAFGYLANEAAYAVSWAKQQKIWALDSGAVLGRIRKHDYSGCRAVAASDAGLLAIADMRGNVFVSNEPGEVAKLRFAFEGFDTVKSVAWDGERLLMAVSTDQQTGALYSWRAGDESPERVSPDFPVAETPVIADSFVARRILRTPERAFELPLHLEIIPKDEWR